MVSDLPGDISITCDNPDIPTGADNLAHRAATLFSQAINCQINCRIHLKKNIPSGAGLGGGSSNAATVLLALNKLYGEPLNLTQLCYLGAQIGSDVPVFVHGWPAALCTGRGELISPANTQAPLPSHCLLIKPAFPVPTPWAYKAYAEMAQGDSQRVTALARVRQFAWGELRNDLEPPVFAKYLWLPATVQWLESLEGISAAAMSGSGSTVFALLSPSADTQSLLNACYKRFSPSTMISLCQIGAAPTTSNN